MSDPIQRLMAYFQPIDAYLELPSAERLNARTPNDPIGFYPIDLEPRLASGHFDRFDARGLPIRPSGNSGRYVHNYTTLCAFALAHWDASLKTQDDPSFSHLINVANYIEETCAYSGDVARLLSEIPDRGHVGSVSANYNGQAISVLSRAWVKTKRQAYLDLAARLLGIFQLPVAEGGVLGRIEKLSVPWFEEDLRPEWGHILNGMIYSLWGIRDFVACTQDGRAKAIFNGGIESVLRALPAYDCTYWSYYSLPDGRPPYTASAVYHALHRCQMATLFHWTGEARFREYQTRFSDYGGSVMCRVRAALAIARAKIRTKYVPN